MGQIVKEKKVINILNRLYEELGIKKDNEFCKKYDIKASTLSSWKKRDSVPYEVIEEISQNENLSLDYILLGKKDYQNDNSIEINGDKNKSKIEQGNTTINGNININTSEFNHGHDIKEIIDLLQYAPSEFLNILKERLKKFRELTHL